MTVWTGDTKHFLEHGRQQFYAAWAWLETAKAEAESDGREVLSVSKSFYGDSAVVYRDKCEAAKLQNTILNTYAEPNVPKDWETPGIHLGQRIRGLLLEAWEELAQDGTVFYRELLDRFNALARQDSVIGRVPSDELRLWAPDRWVESLGREVVKRQHWRYIPAGERRLAKQYRGNGPALLEALASAKTTRRRNTVLSALADIGQLPEEYISAEAAGKPSEAGEVELDVPLAAEVVAPQGWKPTPEDEAEFKQWKLHLLTGLVKKRRSAFHRALGEVSRPGTLRLALQEVPGTFEADRRCALIEKRLAKLAA